MTRCSWAACDLPGRKQDDDGWWHCAAHWDLHIDFQQEDEQASSKCDPRRNTRNRVLELIDGGLRNDAIAAQVGVDISRVYQIRRSAGLVVKNRQAKCGTRAGRQRHRDYDEEPCTPCVEAERAYQQERWQRKKRKGVAA